MNKIEAHHRTKKPRLVLTTTTRLHGDPRTTGRQETASERRRRRREESRGHRVRRNPIGRQEESSSLESNPCADVPVIESVRPEGREQMADGRCHGRTKVGTRCRRKTSELYCPTHEDQV